MFDAHCHLQDERLREQIGEVLVRAREAGVEGMVCCGCEEGDWGLVADLAKAHREIVPAFGLHPWYAAGRSPAWLERLEATLVANPGAGVGEIGLDHAVAERADVAQMEVFVAQLKLAQRLQRPASVHCRKAWEALLEALDRVGELPAGFLVHSYGGSAEMVRVLAARGAHFSFSGSLTHPRNRRAREACAVVPADRLLVETDAPDIVPSIVSDEMPSEHASATDGPNEPRFLGHVVRAAARARGVPADALAALTLANARRLFGLPPGQQERQEPT